ncbi:hypothetical protein [Halopseudomonas aestusnigri]|jgi:hypothetical protein|uniref:hypothetical protein n=1 Tax=Halopseudomonas aestusnigri TaxID=857252 RepID=UPI000C4A6452|nr:hypothetical protein [Pseudomonadales bacterium]|tara:strand:- start:948 stop:1277 length:330 start_codon:yes stop_codon:yes gene_type:complete
MEKLSAPEIKAMKEVHGPLPEDYLAWLSEKGWGEQESGIMLYSGPLYASEIFGDQYPSALEGVLLIGDNMAGYSIGYRSSDQGWQFVGFDSIGSDLDIVEEELDSYLKS